MKATKNVCVLLVVVVSFCMHQSFSQTAANTKNLIRYIVITGDTTARFVYNTTHKLSETEGRNGYSKFYYDNEGNLIREDNAWHPDAYKATFDPGKKRNVMTAANSKITNYSTFEYDTAGMLKEVKHYASNFDKQENEFEFKSSTTFSYDDRRRIVRSNLCAPDGTITQFNSYEYDKWGNMVRTKYFVYEGSEKKATLVSTTTYRFDDKRNYNLVFPDKSRPGYHTNTNNVIETKFVNKEFPLYNTGSESIFYYNSDGFPARETVNKTTFTFVYE